MRLPTFYEEREQTVEILLGILNDRIGCIAGERKWSAHDVVQALRFRVGQQLSLSQNDGEAQDSIERSHVKRLLGLEHFLGRKVMFAVGHACISKRYLDANCPGSAPNSRFACARAAIALLKTSGCKVDVTSG